MTRLARFVAGTILTVALLCTGVITLARSQPHTSYLRGLGFDTCGDSPCFQGIVPGRTGWRESIVRMSALLDAPDPAALRYAALEQHGMAVSFGGNNTESPDYILILFMYDNRRALFGDLVALYGAPCVLALPRYMGGKINVGAFAVQYRSLIAAADSAAGRISAFSRLASIRLSGIGADQACSVDFTPTPDMFEDHWAGFLKTAQYAARRHP